MINHSMVVQKKGISVAPAAISVVTMIAGLAKKMDQPSENPHEEGVELKLLCEKLTNKEAHILRQIVLSESKSRNERRLALYLLNQRPTDFLDLIYEIAVSESSAFALKASAHSKLMEEQEFEASLRVQAMRALEQASISADQRFSLFSEAANRHSNLYLRKMARIGVMGARFDSPMISEYMDVTLKGVLGEISN